MSEKEYVALYTHQKTKKAKTWQDGTLRLNLQTSRAVLLDEGGRRLDKLFIKNAQSRSICNEDFESDRYLIQVEDEKAPSTGNNVTPCIVPTTQSSASATPAVSTESLAPLKSSPSQVRPGGLRTGLKRKRTGFVPPRQVRLPPREPDEPPPHQQDPGIPTPRPAAQPPGLFGAIGHRSSLLTLYSDRSKVGSDESKSNEVHGGTESAADSHSHGGYNNKQDDLSCSVVNIQNYDHTPYHQPTKRQDNDFRHESTELQAQDQKGISKRSASQILALIGGKKNMKCSSQEEGSRVPKYQILSSAVDAIPSDDRPHTDTLNAENKECVTNEERLAGMKMKGGLFKTHNFMPQLQPKKAVIPDIRNNDRHTMYDNCVMSADGEDHSSLSCSLDSVNTDGLLSSQGQRSRSDLTNSLVCSEGQMSRLDLKNNTLGSQGQMSRSDLTNSHHLPNDYGALSGMELPMTSQQSITKTDQTYDTVTTEPEEVLSSETSKEFVKEQNVSQSVMSINDRDFSTPSVSPSCNTQNTFDKGLYNVSSNFQSFPIGNKFKDELCDHSEKNIEQQESVLTLGKNDISALGDLCGSDFGDDDDDDAPDEMTFDMGFSPFSTSGSHCHEQMGETKQEDDESHSYQLIDIQQIPDEDVSPSDQCDNQNELNVKQSREESLTEPQGYDLKDMTKVKQSKAGSLSNSQGYDIQNEMMVKPSSDEILTASQQSDLLKETKSKKSGNDMPSVSPKGAAPNDANGAGSHSTATETNSEDFVIDTDVPLSESVVRMTTNSKEKNTDNIDLIYTDAKNRDGIIMIKEDEKEDLKTELGYTDNERLDRKPNRDASFDVHKQPPYQNEKSTTETIESSHLFPDLHVDERKPALAVLHEGDTDAQNCKGKFCSDHEQNTLATQDDLFQDAEVNNIPDVTEDHQIINKESQDSFCDRNMDLVHSVRSQKDMSESKQNLQDSGDLIDSGMVSKFSSDDKENQSVDLLIKRVGNKDPLTNFTNARNNHGVNDLNDLDLSVPINDQDSPGEYSPQIPLIMMGAIATRSPAKDIKTPFEGDAYEKDEFDGTSCVSSTQSLNRRSVLQNFQECGRNSKVISCNNIISSFSHNNQTMNYSDPTHLRSSTNTDYYHAKNHFEVDMSKGKMPDEMSAKFGFLPQSRNHHEIKHYLLPGFDVMRRPPMTPLSGELGLSQQRCTQLVSRTQETNKANLITKGGITSGFLEQSLAQSLPHPNRAFRGQDSAIQKSGPQVPQKMTTDRDLPALANARLDKYTVKGSVKSETATRSTSASERPLNVESRARRPADEEQPAFHQPTQTVCMDSSQVLENCQDEASLYWLDLNPQKKQFDHASKFLTTPHDLMSRGSPCQQVPVTPCALDGLASPVCEATHQVPRVSPAQTDTVGTSGLTESRSSSYWERKPLKTHPFSDTVQHDSYTSYSQVAPTPASAYVRGHSPAEERFITQNKYEADDITTRSDQMMATAAQVARSRWGQYIDEDADETMVESQDVTAASVPGPYLNHFTDEDAEKVMKDIPAVAASSRWGQFTDEDADETVIESQNVTAAASVPMPGWGHFSDEEGEEVMTVKKDIPAVAPRSRWGQFTDKNADVMMTKNQNVLAAGPGSDWNNDSDHDADEVMRVDEDVPVAAARSRWGQFTDKDAEQVSEYQAVKGTYHGRFSPRLPQMKRNADPINDNQDEDVDEAECYNTESESPLIDPSLKQSSRDIRSVHNVTTELDIPLRQLRPPHVPCQSQSRSIIGAESSATNQTGQCEENAGKELLPESHMQSPHLSHKTPSQMTPVFTQAKYDNVSDNRLQSTPSLFTDSLKPNSEPSMILNHFQPSTGVQIPTDVPNTRLDLTVNQSQPTGARRVQRRFKPPAFIRDAAVSPALQRTPRFINESPVNAGHSNSLAYTQTNRAVQNLAHTELTFPSKSTLEGSTGVLVRRCSIPATFCSLQEYKHALSTALNEHMNTIFFDLAKNFHISMARVDISNYVPSFKGSYVGMRGSGGAVSSHNPTCDHGAPSRMVQVKKDGPNKGRYFFACDEQRDKQCKFFKWADQAGGGKSGSQTPGGVSRMKLADGESITTYLKGMNISLYADCQLLRKSQQDIRAHFSKSKWAKKFRNDEESISKKKLFLRLSRRENSSAYAKDDVWVISQHMNFEPRRTFLAKSVFYGPSSEGEVEIEPIGPFSPSNWDNEVMCVAIHAHNIANELACLQNIKDHVTSTLPLLPSLLSSESSLRQAQTAYQSSSQYLQKNIFVPWDMVLIITECSGNNCAKTITISLAICKISITFHFSPFTSTTKNGCVNMLKIDKGTQFEEYINKYRLNIDQATSLRNISGMFCPDASQKQQAWSSCVTLIHGVFGAGKSFLLAVVVLFLVRLFELNDSYTPGVPRPMKILISSTTNVAVDRILQGLLDLEFEEFIRVGSVKKIAKPVLPFSVHAVGSKSQELKELQEMLKGEITPSEKHYVRKSIEKLRLGENKKKLGVVRVVGVTCAASSFTCLSTMTFPVVLLDECSQMTEPASLLPIARFECEKLVLVGDPKQLSPTIGGFESVHDQGLEQTLFNRFVRMGHVPVMLRTQYRCHPTISAIPNALFYDGQLMDGVSQHDRPSLAYNFPTLAFYDVHEGQENYDSKYASYHNLQEAEFVVSMIDGLLMSGVEPKMIGVITLYRSQMQKIKGILQASKLTEGAELQAVQVSTVDAFQGGEKDVIILSCVRTRNVGFIDSDKRTNVALSRSRHHLLIVGHLQNLEKNALWGKVIQHCRDAPDGIQDVAKFQEWIGYQRNQRASEVNELSQPLSVTSKKKGQGRKRRQRSPSPPESVCSSPKLWEASSENPERIEDSGSDFESSPGCVSMAPADSAVKKRPRRSCHIDSALFQTQQECFNSDGDDWDGQLPDILSAS